MGPVRVAARSTTEVNLVVYIPTTVREDSYVLPIEVEPEPRDIISEQGCVAR